MGFTAVYYLALHIRVQCVQDVFHGGMKEACVSLQTKMGIHVLCVQYVF